ncbi:MAG: FkbM family methyltransferase [Bacteroidetes bacterium]|nr:FkbM family methyltransferase [Bacteroidota bacterium]
MKDLISKIEFHGRRLYVFLFISFKKLINNPWEKVSGIFLPISKNIGFNTLRWIINGQYEQDEINIIKHKLQDGDTVLEIGTGLGFVSTYCSKKIGSEKVFTFEANPFNVETAMQVFKKNDVAPTIKNALLADEQGTAFFYIDKKSRLASSSLKNTYQEISIEKIKLNDLIALVKPNFLVMDIEGGEYDIFNMIDFQSIKKIQFELHPLILDERKCEEIFSVLEKNGFKKDPVVSSGQNYYYSLAR